MSYEDRQLTCVECGQSFTFTADDQAYHAERGYMHDPKRCPDCRTARRAGRGDSSGAYSGGSSGGSRFAGPRPDRPMFDVTCAACGKATQVPFEPRGDRPVYCSDCFRQQSPARSDRGGGYRGARESRGGGYGRGGRY